MLVTSIPASIDASGATDVTAPLTDFLASHIGDEVTWAAGGVYRVDTGITLTEPSDTTWHGNDATLVVPVESSLTLRYGVQNLKLLGGEAFDVDHLRFAGANRAPRFNPAYFEWQLVRAHGLIGSSFTQCAFANAWADWFYFGQHRGVPCQSVTLGASVMSIAGRQGIVINSAIGCNIVDNIMNGVAHWVFDSECGASDEISDLTIARNKTPRGGLGWYHLGCPASAVIHDFALTDNEITNGQMTVQFDVEPTPVPPRVKFARYGLEIARNKGNAVYPDRQPPMFKLFSWDDIYVHENDLYVAYDPAKAIGGGVGATVLAPNFTQVTPIV